MKQVKTAVVGCGAISDIYLTNLKGMFSIIDLYGCYDRHEDKCQAAAQKHQIRALTMREILEDPSIELVVNLTNPKSHYQVTRQLLEANKNVYTEKVLAVSLEEARELVELADRRKLYLGAAPDTFLGAAVQTARHAVESGLIGKVTSCFAQDVRDYRMMSQYVPFIASPGGGMGFDVGIYYITALVSILGSVREVSGFLKYTDEPGRITQPRSERFDETYPFQPETILAGSLRFDSGVIGSVQFNSESIFPEQPDVMICGTEGVLYMADPNCFGGKVSYRVKGSEERIALPVRFGYEGNSRGLGVAEMAWSMRRGRKNRANKEMAYHALEVLHGISISSESGLRYTLKSDFARMPPLPSGHMDGYLDMDSEAALI